MGFWIFMFISNNLIPLIMLVIGIVFANHPPKQINAVVGYRTTMSMKNQKTWDFAHHYCGKIWRKIGAIMLLPTVIITLLCYGKSEDVIGNASLVLVTVQVALLLASIYPVEKALKKNFDKNGNPRVDSKLE